MYHISFVLSKYAYMALFVIVRELQFGKVWMTHRKLLTKCMRLVRDSEFTASGPKWRLSCVCKTKQRRQKNKTSFSLFCVFFFFFLPTSTQFAYMNYTTHITVLLCFGCGRRIDIALLNKFFLWPLSNLTGQFAYFRLWRHTVELESRKQGGRDANILHVVFTAEVEIATARLCS